MHSDAEEEAWRALSKELGETLFEVEGGQQQFTIRHFQIPYINPS